MAIVLKALAAAAFLGASATLAAAAPANNTSQIPSGVSSELLQQVHGDHNSCRRDRRGWHRHNRWGERRPCRRWDGRGRRPGACVQVGPVWYCG